MEKRSKVSLTDKEMFERSFQRPHNFLSLSAEERWEIDKKLGILDWEPKILTKEEKKRLRKHYKPDAK